MHLSAPTQPFFIASAVIALIGFLVGIGVFSFIPISGFLLMTIAWIILAAGCMLPGV